MMRSSATAKIEPIGRGGPEGEISARVNELIDASRQGDLDRIMSFYSPDVVAYDCPPNLRIHGRELYKKSKDKWSISQFNFPVDYERREEQITVSGDLAVVTGLTHVQGVFKSSGESASAWLRHTIVFGRQSGQWLITHEHLSVPVGEDLVALMDLAPERDNPV